MYGAVLKKFSKELLDCEPDEIYMCSVMPCVRKRGESDEPVFRRETVRDVDNVITTKDLGTMLQAKGIDPLQLEPMQYDSPFQSQEAQGSGLGTGAGQLFGATGGVMEAAVRSVYELVTGDQLPRLELEEVRGLEDVKEATVSLFNEETGRGLDIDLKLAVVNGLGTAKKLLAKMKSGDVHYDFVEVMACPGVSIHVHTLQHETYGFDSLYCLLCRDASMEEANLVARPKTLSRSGWTVFTRWINSFLFVDHTRIQSSRRCTSGILETSMVLPKHMTYCTSIKSTEAQKTSKRPSRSVVAKSVMKSETLEYCCQTLEI